MLAQAEFVPFAPAPCVCCSGCHSDEARARTYAHVYENRIERNYPAAPFACCTSEVCIVDRVWVTYFDRPPMRAGMCCFCIPATCCGPPVIYSKTPKCCCFDLTPCYGQAVLAAPAVFASSAVSSSK